MLLNLNHRVGVLTAMAALSLCAPAVAATPSFPAKPITLMVPYPAGGTSDALARALAKTMAAELGQPVIVENLGGASGAIAARKVLNLPADGYYIYVGSPNELILAPLVIGSAKFTSEEFRMVQKVGDLTLAVLSRGDLPVANVDELAQYAAQRAKSGHPLTYGSVGVGSLYHLLGEKFSQSIGTPLLHVPYKGGTPMTLDLVGGQIDLFLGALGTNSAGFIRDKKIKMLAVVSPERSAEFQNVPATADAKSLKDYSYSLWVGLLVKKDTPEPVVNTLRQAITAALRDSALKTSAESANVIVAKPQSLSQAQDDYSRSVAQYRSIAKSISLQP
ncbi:Bug family tripartite tricarboxylate transporter substrate binding protein [Cupriavidus consociatus]|uniref:Bug family tripartite tricarboxylate transporter substrate binding protein n=1 Tax=Cupriavidus consociatus TaxID=2821357 RepID=UPI001AE1D802|nr:MULTISPECIES: tripartite tricarboxylate transporter substrate binding protein [unclassified Cupriavidus]MBP0625081.1 tripartite tricarboxylate transporter substrate binding protein [Cupriavidus sp. LEh25]MDK2661817.1 tripartite tricarboxylate transporter substrate binding protein [Cupriavidus sp. LEh21]